MGRCNQQVARLQINGLPSWIPQVGCYAPDSKCGHPSTKLGLLHVNNNGDVPGLLFVHKGNSSCGKLGLQELNLIKYGGAGTVPQLLHVGIRNSDDHAQTSIINKDE